jgi:glycosyltransferase involved in cell wall biosynthesis
MTNKPLLSILIATKNRQAYALHAVKSILTIKDEGLELVIQDNSDSNSLESDIKEYLTDTRLKYRYTPPPFSSIDNFNAAIQMSTGEYVCLIGDDDGINPEIMYATAWAKISQIDCLVGNTAADYRWAGTGVKSTFYRNTEGNTLTISNITGKVDEPDLAGSLSRLAKNGCTHYLDYPFPKLYHGVVKRDCLEQIRCLTGAYIKGLSPDIYLAVALTSVVKKMITIDYPLTIPGVCAKSTSVTEGQMKTHSKEIKDAPHFRDRGPYVWSENVPPVYCVETIWADSAIAALKDIGRHDLIRTFNRYRLYAYIIGRAPSLKAEVIKHIEKQGNQQFGGYSSNNVKLYWEYIAGPLRRFIMMKIFKRLLVIIKVDRRITINGLEDIHAASLALRQYLNKSNMNIENILVG